MVTVGVLQLSVIAGVLNIIPVASHELRSVLATTFGIQNIVGTSASFTVTVNEQLAVLPAASVTTNVLVVVPSGKIAPEINPLVCVVTAPLQLSVPTGAT